MSWLPRLEIIAGKLQGLTPFGTLDGVPAYLENNFFTSGDGSGGCSQYDEMPWEPGLKTWAGAYGSDMSGMVAEAQQSSLTDVLFAEIPVKLPEGATFFKHTINFYGNIICNRGSDTDHTWDELDFSLGRVTRKVYADPNSPYVETALGSITSPNNLVYFKLLMGDGSTFPYAQLNNARTGFGFYTYNDTEYFGANIYVRGRLENYDTGSTGAFLSGLSVDYLSREFGVDFEDSLEEIDDPNEEPDPEPGPGGGGGGGGEGKHKLPDDPVPIPPLPSLGSASVSWLTVYMMDKQDIDDFGQELVTPTPFQQLKQYFNDPLDAIVGIMLVPAVAGPRVAKTPRIHGTPDYVWSRSFMAIGNQYARVNCGTILIEPYWDSAFDFDPYTRFTIFLPFIGYKTLKADDIMGATIEVEYHIDVCTGDCTAFIVRSAASDMIYGPMAQQVIAQFNGNCGVRVPIGRISHDAAVDASMRLLTAGIGIAGGAAMAGLGLVDAGNISMSQASNQISGAAMSAINAQKRSIERSGALGGNTGYMGVLKPYLIRQIPRQFLPDNYKQLNGYPANKGGTLDHFRGSGYQAIETIELDNLVAYDNEIDEIRTLLKGGVLV